MILYRCFAWDQRAGQTDPDGALWAPRPFQGEGRHDNPDLYGCLYLADRALSAVVEQLARFRTQRLSPALLHRRRLPLALAALEMSDRSELIDLDDPVVLRRERLRPSRVATRSRAVTQPQARTIHERHPAAAGLRWWSTYEALWMHVTLFDRALPQLTVQHASALSADDPVVGDAAAFLALPVK